MAMASARAPTLPLLLLPLLLASYPPAVYAGRNVAAAAPALAPVDSRNASFPFGTIFAPAGGVGYSDQPQVVPVNASFWLCVLTCSSAREGQRNQIAATVVSRTGGRTWSKPVSIEPLPARGERIAASWVNPLLLADGRLYVFYTYNLLNTTRWPSTNASISNSNLLGGQFFRSSTDFGSTWSDRVQVPLRPTQIDRQNSFGGRIPMGWSVGKPIVTTDGTAFFQLTKIGCPPSEAARCDMVVSYDEGWLFASHDLVNSSQPTFVTLPAGDVGLTAHNRTGNESFLAPLHDDDGLIMTVASPVAAQQLPPPPPIPTGQNSWIAEEGDVVEMGAFTPAHLYYTYRTSGAWIVVPPSLGPLFVVVVVVVVVVVDDVDVGWNFPYANVCSCHVKK
jgi:hypothetical protein